MVLDMKTVLPSDRTQNIDLNRIISHFNNFKNTFTPLEKESNLKLNEPASCSLKSNVKRIKSQHGINRKKIKSNSTLLSPNKITSCAFCSISGHRTTGCLLKKGIGTEITVVSLIEYLQTNDPFKSLGY